MVEIEYRAYWNIFFFFFFQIIEKQIFPQPYHEFLCLDLNFFNQSAKGLSNLILSLKMVQWFNYLNFLICPVHKEQVTLIYFYFYHQFNYQHDFRVSSAPLSYSIICLTIFTQQDFDIFFHPYIYLSLLAITLSIQIMKATSPSPQLSPLILLIFYLLLFLQFAQPITTDPYGTKIVRANISDTKQNILAKFQSIPQFITIPLEVKQFMFTLKMKVNGIQYNMIVDTGSSDTFIKGQSIVLEDSNILRQSANLNKSIQLSYLDGKIRAYQVFVQIQFNGKKMNSSLLYAYNTDKRYQQTQGIIGLSYPESAIHKPSFIESLISNRLIKKHAYGIKLNRILQQDSYINFGDPDLNSFEGKMNYFPLINFRYLVLNVKSFSVGKTELRLMTGLVDTGNSCLTFSNRFQEKILSVFNTFSNRCIFEKQQNNLSFSLLLCRIQQMSQLPILKLNIGGVSFPIQKQHYLHKCVRNPKENETDIYYCSLYIETSKHNLNNLAIIGAAFLNRYYTYFDFEKKQIGIGKNKVNITLSEIYQANKIWVQEQWNSFFFSNQIY